MRLGGSPRAPCYDCRERRSGVGCPPDPSLGRLLTFRASMRPGSPARSALGIRAATLARGVARRRRRAAPIGRRRRSVRELDTRVTSFPRAPTESGEAAELRSVRGAEQ